MKNDLKKFVSGITVVAFTTLQILPSQSLFADPIAELNPNNQITPTVSATENPNQVSEEINEIVDSTNTSEFLMDDHPLSPATDELEEVEDALAAPAGVEEENEIHSESSEIGHVHGPQCGHTLDGHEYMRAESGSIVSQTGSNNSTEGDWMFVMSGSSQTGQLKVYDDQGDLLTFSLITGPGKGTLTLNANGSYEFTPTEGAFGADRFTYRVTDNNGESMDLSVVIIIQDRAVYIQPIQICDNAGNNCANPARNYFEDVTNMIYGQAGVKVVWMPWQVQNDGDLLNISSESQAFARWGTYGSEGNFNSGNIAPMYFVKFLVDSGSLGLTEQGLSMYIPDRTVGADGGAGFLGTIAHEIGHRLFLFHTTDSTNMMSTTANHVQDISHFNPFTGTRDLLTETQINTIRNGGGFSRPAETIDIHTPIVAGALPTDKVFSNTDPIDIPIVVMDPDTPSENLTVTATSGTASVVTNANISILGTGTHRTIRIIPANNTGESLITVRVSDGVNQSLTGFNFKFNKTNKAPIVGETLVTTAEDTAIIFNANVTDPESQPLEFSFRGNPGTTMTTYSNGTVTYLGNGQYRYNPASNFTGEDSFYYNVSDGTHWSTGHFVRFTVTAVQDAPTATTSAIKAMPNRSNTGTLAGTDADGNTITFELVSGPANGVFELNANGSYAYTPNSSFTGTDTLTYRTFDGIAYSANRTVTITIPVVDKVVKIQPIQVCNNAGSACAAVMGNLQEEATSKLLSQAGVRVEYLPMKTLHMTAAQNVTTNSADATRLFVDTLFNGDSATYQSSSDPSVINLWFVTSIQNGGNNVINYGLTGDSGIVISTSGATTISNLTAIAREIARNLGLSDDATSNNLMLTSNPSGLKLDELTMSRGLLTVAQNNTIRASSFLQNFVPASTQAPTIAAIANQTIMEDGTVVVDLNLGDADSDVNALTVTASSSNVILMSSATTMVVGGSGANRTLTLRPGSQSSGVTTITVNVSDGTFVTSKTFSLTVTAFNDAPTIGNIANQTIPANQSKSVSFTVSDVESFYSLLTATATSSNTALVDASGISLSRLGSTWTLNVEPLPDASGVTTISVDVSDGVNVSTKTFTLTVTGGTPVQAPVFVSTISAQTINEDTASSALAITLSDADTLPANLNVTAVSSNQSLIANAGLVLGGSGLNRTLTINPAANASGTATITVTLTDGTTPVTQTFNVTVNAVNDAPTITAVSHQSINEDVNLNGINFTIGDVEAAAASLTVTASSSNTALIDATGIVVSGSGANRTVSLTPKANQSGTATITINVNDGTITTPMTFTLTVNAVDDAPVVSAISANDVVDIDPVKAGLQINKGTKVKFSATATDIDSATLSWYWVSNPLAIGEELVHSGQGAIEDFEFVFNEVGNNFWTLRVGDQTTTIEMNFMVEIIDVPMEPQVPTISAISNQSVNEDTESSAISFTIGDLDTALGNLVLSATSSNAGLISDGNIVISGSGVNRTVKVTPAANQSGTAVITVRVRDTDNQEAVQTFTVTVNAVNDIPTATFNSLTGVSEDVVKSFTLTGSDVEGNALSYIIVTNPTHGTLSCTLSDCTYTPTGNYNGADSFTYKVNDGTADSSSVTINFSVAEINDAPAATLSSLTSVNEDLVRSFTLTGSDVDGNPLTYTIVSQPSHGTVSCTGANCTYTPTGNYNGADSFTYKVNDGTIDSTTVTVNFNVAAVNDVPVATFTSLASVTEDEVKSFTLTGTDVEGSALTYSIVSQASHGVVNCTGASCTYTPTGNYSGNDSFIYKVNDGTVDSLSVTISFNVAAVNDLPTATLTTLAGVSEDTQKTFTLTGNDIDGNPLTFSVVSGSLHGTLNCTGASCTYTPTGNYSGNDSFTYKVNDGTIDSSSVTVSFSVAAVNDAPTATLSSLASVSEDVVKTFTLTGSDIEGNTLTYTIVSQPAHGTVSCTGANCTYTPLGNYNGADSFTYKVNDGNLDSTPVTVNFNVTAVNDAPTASNGVHTIEEEETLNGNVIGADVEGNPLTYILVGNATHGTLTFNANGSFVYLPAADYFGADSFSFKVSDGTLESEVKTVNLTITEFNDAPTLTVIGNQSMSEDASFSGIGFTIGDAETASDALIVTATSSNQALMKDAKLTFSGTGSTRSLSMSPETNAFGTAVITVTVTDGSKVMTRTFNVTVNAVNDKPVANVASKAGNEDSVLSGTLTASDIEGDALTYLLVSNVTHGTLTLNADGTYSYTPNGNFNGSDSFTFKVNDGNLDSDSVTINLTVNAVNDKPVANVSSKAGDEDTVISGSLTASDVEGSALTYSLVSNVSKGILTLNADGTYLYTPNANFNGSDSFTFKVNDGNLDSDPVTVNLTVNAVNDAPVATFNSLTAVSEDAVKSFTLTGSDVDGNPLTYSIVSQPSHGIVSCTGANCTYAPSGNYNGADSFSYKVNDGTADSNPVTVSFNVSAVNDAPVPDAINVAMNEDGTVEVRLTGTDLEGDTLTFIPDLSYCASCGKYYSDEGELIPGAGEGVYTFKPYENFNGVVNFEYFINDGTNNSISASVTITIAEVNDKPVATVDTKTSNEDTSLSGNVSGSDIENSPLTYILVSNVTNGTLTLNSDGSYTYIPTANFNGSDSFAYKVNDGELDSDPVTVTLNVTAVNDVPTLGVISNLAINEDAVQQTINLTGISAGPNESETVTVTVTSNNPTLLTNLQVVNNVLSFTPASNGFGVVTVTVTVTDSFGLSTTRTFSVTVNEVNDAPVLNDLNNQNVAENEAIHVTLSGSDPDGDNLTYAATNLPAGATLIENVFQWTPGFNQSGNYVVTFTVSDGNLTATKTLNIAVGNVNRAPTIDAVPEITKSENEVISLNLVSSDPDGDALTITSSNLPSGATLTGNAFSWTPGFTQAGTYMITFRVSDGTLTFDRNVSIIVSNLNRDPVVPNVTVPALNEDSSVVIELGPITDADADVIGLSISSHPAHGTLIADKLDPMKFTYIPSTNFHGTDSFMYRVTDGIATITKTINLTMNAVNDAPEMGAIPVQGTKENQTWNLILEAKDADREALTFSATGMPQGMALSGNQLLWTPDYKQAGTHTVTVTVSDGKETVTRVMEIVVANVNRAPVLKGLELKGERVSEKGMEMDSEEALSFEIIGTDLDEDGLNYEVQLSNEKAGELTLNGSSITLNVKEPLDMRVLVSDAESKSEMMMIRFEMRKTEEGMKLFIRDVSELLKARVQDSADKRSNVVVLKVDAPIEVRKEAAPDLFAPSAISKVSLVDSFFRTNELFSSSSNKRRDYEKYLMEYLHNEEEDKRREIMESSYTKVGMNQAALLAAPQGVGEMKIGQHLESFFPDQNYLSILGEQMEKVSELPTQDAFINPKEVKAMAQVHQKTHAKNQKIKAILDKQKKKS